MPIDPHNTSMECPGCHSISKRNRPERSHFRCISCGLEGEADLIASLNIRSRSAINQPIVAGAIFDHMIPQLQAPML
ncbi:MAG: zinc ribbon domain-containing protein [Thermoplasmata archaeon]